MAKIEAAVPRTVKEVYKRCIKRQNEEEECKQTIEDAPTLIQVEETLRAAKAGTAGGPDGLDPAWLHIAPAEMGPWVWQIVMKQHLWQVEAIQHKGGNLTMLEKKRGAACPQDYRPIMLLSVMARRLHSLIREPLMAQLEEDKQIGQIGGFRNQSPQFGSHLVRTIQKVAKVKGLCSAVVFLDLQTAFHSLLRELTLGTNRNDQAAKEEIMKNLRRIQVDEEEVKKKMEEEIYLEAIGAPKRLLNQLRDIGQENWVILYGHQMQTMKGTRPGSPLADAVFHSGMAVVQRELNEKLQSEDLRKRFDELGLTNCPVTWADDVAIPVIADSAQALDEAIEEIGAQASQSFRARGMKLNYAKAKSEVIIGLAGPGAKEGRQRMLGGEKKDNTIRQEGGKSAKISNVARYRHLGVQQQACGDMKEEIAYRIEQAWGAWRPLAAPVFLNRNLKIKTRLQLWTSLVLTKLYYAAGSWPVLPASLLKKVEATEMKMLRRITGDQYQEGKKRKKNEEIRRKYRHPEARIRIAQERMAYAGRLFRHAEEPLKKAVQVEYHVTEDSWMHGLWADITWFVELQGEEKPKDQRELEERCKSRGWKKQVKKAIKRHLLQEEIIGKLEEKGRVEEDEEQGEEEKERQEEWKCECGKICKTKTGLAVHKRQKHGLQAPEACAGRGSRCEMCLRECWTQARLRQHLAYIPRANTTNRCYAMYAYRRQESMMEDEEDERKDEEKQWRLKGINRRDAIEAQGPKICGMYKEDEAWAEKERDKLEDKLKSLLTTEEFEEIMEKDRREECEMTFRLGGQITEILENLEKEGKSPHWTLLRLALWGYTRSWEDTEAQREWLSYLQDVEEGDHILDWLKIQEKVTFIQNVNTMQPHREVYRGAVNKTERNTRDAAIRTKGGELRGRLRSRVEKDLLSKIYDPETKMAELGKILRDL